MAEKLLGRPLLPREVVHHNDGDKRHNAWDNLEVLSSQSEHARIHGFGKRQETRVSNSFEQTDRIHEIAEKEAGAEETREFRIFGPP